jgi:hypothetical protein
MLNSPPMFRQVALRGQRRHALGAFPDFDMPDFQMPEFDLSPPAPPALPPADGGAPAPAAPAPGAEVPLAPAFQPRYVLPVQEQPPAETPTKPEPEPEAGAPAAGGMSPLVWVGIAAVGVIAIVSLAR